jgi:hypothetical protein
VARDLPVGLPQSIWDSIKATNAEDVNIALRQYFDPSQLCRIRVGNFAAAALANK